MRQKEMQDLVGRLGAGDRELYEERAAVREFDGLQPRETAEALALLDVLRLRPRRCSASGCCTPRSRASRGARCSPAATGAG